MAKFGKNSTNKEKKNIFESLEELDVGTSFIVDSVRDTEYGVFFNLVLFDAVIIFGCRVVEGKNGDFVAMPSRKAGERYYNYVGIKLSEELTQEILNAVEEKL